jgi:hypothetical protein
MDDVIRSGPVAAELRMAFFVHWMMRRSGWIDGRLSAELMMPDGSNACRSEAWLRKADKAA